MWVSGAGRVATDHLTLCILLVVKQNSKQPQDATFGKAKPSESSEPRKWVPQGRNTASLVHQ